MSTNRKVHAAGKWLEIVRYETGGHWYVEVAEPGKYWKYSQINISADVTTRLTSHLRKKLKVVEAVDCAIYHEMTHVPGVPGGTEFDRLFALSKEAAS